MAPKERTMAILGLSLLAVSVFLITFYAIADPTETSFGERYVIPEIPLLFPFYRLSSFKPITLITYLTFAGTVLILEANKIRLKAFDTRVIRIILVCFAFASGYELLWNMFAWFATWLKVGGSLDMLANTFHEYKQVPVNFNFVTKLLFLVFALSVYGYRFLGELDRKPTPEAK